MNIDMCMTVISAGILSQSLILFRQFVADVNNNILVFLRKKYVCLFVCFTADDRKAVPNPAIKA